jgi:perosamine synthetase
LIPVSRPFVSPEDKEAVQKALDSTWLSGDTPPIIMMEDTLSKVVGVKHSVAISSGTAALDLAIEALEIGKDDECIVPTFTIISTIARLLRVGAKIKLVDSDPQNWSIDPAGVASELTNLTKLVIPVHIYGLSADVEKIKDITSEVNPFILEDAAEALGVSANGRQCGSLGDGAIFSFYANKVVTGGEGGAFCTNDDELADRVRGLRNLNFIPEERFMSMYLGYNQRLNGLSAALINSQLHRLPELNNRKIMLAARYLENLAGHPWLKFAPQEYNGTINTYWVFPILISENSRFDAKQLQVTMQNMGIQTRRFFCPMHLQPLSEKYNLGYGQKFPVATNLWNRGLYLPSGLGITENEIDKVSEVLWSLTE